MLWMTVKIDETAPSWLYFSTKGRSGGSSSPQDAGDTGVPTTPCRWQAAS
jgi:hypothetical protein